MPWTGFVASPWRCNNTLTSVPTRSTYIPPFLNSFTPSFHHYRAKSFLISKPLRNNPSSSSPSGKSCSSTRFDNHPIRQITCSALLTPQILVVVGGIVAFCLSAALGANDVANSLGTSVGTGAINIGQALAIGAVMEFAGAVLFGSTVTRTISSNVVSIGSVLSPVNYMFGMVCVLIGCTFWMGIATKFGLPVSSTHSVIGSLIGLGLISGWGINYNIVKRIITSWFLSPFIGGIIAFSLHTIVKKMIIHTKRPAKSTRRFLPILVGSTVFILVLFVLGKGHHFNHSLSMDRMIWMAIGTSLTAAGLSGGLATSIHSKEYIKKDILGINGHEITRKEQQEDIERIFKVLQLVTACFLAFSHGSNDVSNAIGPFAAIFTMWKTKYIGSVVVIPPWVLVLGGLGISTGLGLFGKPVMETVGKKITKLKPTMGFSVELSTALTVLIASQLGIPVSTTHTLIGCIVAIGLTNGQKEAVNGKILAGIAGSWGITLPVSAFATVLCYLVFKPLLFPVVAMI